jgi:hypothetical protein
MMTRADLAPLAAVMAVPEIAALLAAARVLQVDMLDRARVGMDVIYGEEYRIVNAGRTAWSDFTAALAALEKKNV